MRADKIIVLDERRVVGEGKHADLLRDCEQYREIAHSQLSPEELESADSDGAVASCEARCDSGDRRICHAPQGCGSEPIPTTAEAPEGGESR